MIEPLLYTTTRLVTLQNGAVLTNATGFFFQRDSELYVGTCLHVLRDEPSGHHPDTIHVEIHTNAENIAETINLIVPLYDSEGSPQWKEGTDSSGPVDIAILKLDPTALPPTAVYQAFTLDHLLAAEHQAEVGQSALIVGFPLGFSDTLHKTPVVRQAVIASSFGLRFQGEGYFLTDARMHRGASGAPVVMRMSSPEAAQQSLPWVLLGVHSARLDVGNRDLQQDEALGLNCAWYADMLLTLTAPS